MTQEVTWIAAGQAFAVKCIILASAADPPLLLISTPVLAAHVAISVSVRLSSMGTSAEDCCSGPDKCKQRCILVCLQCNVQQQVCTAECLPTLAHQLQLKTPNMHLHNLQPCHHSTSPTCVTLVVFCLQHFGPGVDVQHWAAAPDTGG